MPFTSSHPRFTLALFCLLGLTFIVFFNGGAERGAHFSTSFLSSSRGPLDEEMRYSEKQYQKVLMERKALIKEKGPEPKDINPFPQMRGYTLWDFFPPMPNFCLHRIERLGIMGDGGKWVCGMEKIARKKECIIYSVGINGESSYEAALLRRGKHCKVYGYDFSVNGFGPEVENDPDLKRRSHFEAIMLTNISDHTAEIPKWTLADLMKKNGHTWIDILKIDIEGSEFDSLSSLIDAFPGSTSMFDRGGELPFGQLQLEIHVYKNTYADKFENFLKWWQKLEKAGLRPFWTEPNLVYAALNGGTRPDLAEYSFINTKGDHVLISEPRGPKHPPPPPHHA